MADTRSRQEQLPDESEYDWENYKKKFNKSYTPEEEAKRHRIFLKAVETIRMRNEEYVSGKVSFISGVNNLTDWTAEEHSKLCGVRMPGAKKTT